MSDIQNAIVALQALKNLAQQSAQDKKTSQTVKKTLKGILPPEGS
jgi:hypothetical protein